jgi:16S rRNA (guanine527-N7)-methyltransferase
MTTEELALVRQSARDLGVLVDDETAARLDRYLAVLDRWNRTARLTGERDRRTILTRHVIDSLAPVRWLPPAGATVDVGSGAGFPGIILGCVRPDAEIVLVESRRRRASFLAEAVRTIPLPRARVLPVRAEEAVAGALGGTAAAAITRAVRLDVFLPLADLLLAPVGVAIAMQTPSAPAAHVGWRLDDSLPYALPDGRRRVLRKFRRVPA